MNFRPTNEETQPKDFGFPEALKKLIEGEKIQPLPNSKTQTINSETYFYMKDNRVYSHDDREVPEFDMHFALTHRWKIYQEPVEVFTSMKL